MIGGIYKAQPNIDRIKNRLNQKSNSVVDRVIDKSVDKGVGKLLSNSSNASHTQIDKNEIVQSQSNSGLSNGPVAALYKHFSFIPGEQIVYSENFEQQPFGSLPPAWNANSSGNLVKYNNEPWLHLVNGNYITNILNSDFGIDFSVEFDLVLNVMPQIGYYMPYFKFGVFAMGNQSIADNSFLNSRSAHKSFELLLEPSSSLPSKTILVSHHQKKEVFRSNRLENRVLNERLKKLMHVAIAVTGSRLQIWIDEHKLIDVPKAISSAGANFNQLYFGVENTAGYNEGNFAYLIKHIKVAKGIEENRFSLISPHPFVTTGIVFSSNSALLLPYSYGVIRKIGLALMELPNAKIKIIGHTDADGSPNSNMQLSLQRANAVKAALVKDYGISESRILVVGKGSSILVASNNTKEGKAENRRVEFQLVP